MSLKRWAWIFKGGTFCCLVPSLLGYPYPWLIQPPTGSLLQWNQIFTIKINSPEGRDRQDNPIEEESQVSKARPSEGFFQFSGSWTWPLWKPSDPSTYSWSPTARCCPEQETWPALRQVGPCSEPCPKAPDQELPVPQWITAKSQPTGPFWHGRSRETLSPWQSARAW